MILWKKDVMQRASVLEGLEVARKRPECASVTRMTGQLSIIASGKLLTTLLTNISQDTAQIDIVLNPDPPFRFVTWLRLW